MIKVQSSVYPDNKLTFNQVQASLILHNKKNIGIFNQFCTSAKMTQDEIDGVLEDVKLNELYETEN